MSRVWLLLALVGVAIGQKDPNTVEDRQVIVHLFEWKWTDIAEECERFLGPNGFGGVQISPPNEHCAIWEPYRPWYERYQPVSYHLISRSGNEEELIDMIKRCNAVGVRIYADAVINHMAEGGDGVGVGGSNYDPVSYDYTSVPYMWWHFNVPEKHCMNSDGEIHSYTNPEEVRNCNLLGLPDLDTGKSYVQGKITDYLNHLIDLGVAGFRVDACKHIWPDNLRDIFGGLKDLNEDFFPQGSRPFIFQEVIDFGGEGIGCEEYTTLGRVTEFRYGKSLSSGIRGEIKMKHYKNFGQGWRLMSDQDTVVFVDNHDNQRGHGGGGDILTYKQPSKYKQAVTFMLAYPYGFTRLMSSYDFHEDIEGPPHTDNGSTKSVEIDPDGNCGGGWVCEHRWRQIKNMVGFRNVAREQPLRKWWSNKGSQIAFARGNKAFYVLNAEQDTTMNQCLKTGLPKGDYCDVISGDYNGVTCSGRTIHVNSDGRAFFHLDHHAEDAMSAIHVEAMIKDPVMPPEIPTTGFARTVVFIHKHTKMGDNLFVCGGISHSARYGCTSDVESSACAIPIRHNTNEANNLWLLNDDYLDWYGAEDGQGKRGQVAASGTPLIWTTNNPSHFATVSSEGYGYHPLNKYGNHYWMFDVDMDCGKTEGGWFEFKSVLSTDGRVIWESSRHQDGCCGDIAQQKPYSSHNHFARCGRVNVFDFESDNCLITTFE